MIAVGSGVVIATREVVTNCHIIEAGVKWQVKKASQVAPAARRGSTMSHEICASLGGSRGLSPLVH